MSLHPCIFKKVVFSMTNLLYMCYNFILHNACYHDIYSIVSYRFTLAPLQFVLFVLHPTFHIHSILFCPALIPRFMKYIVWLPCLALFLWWLGPENLESQEKLGGWRREERTGTLSPPPFHSDGDSYGVIFLSCFSSHRALVPSVCPSRIWGSNTSSLLLVHGKFTNPCWLH